MKRFPLLTMIAAPQRRLLLCGGVYVLLWISTWYAGALLAGTGGVSLWFLPAALRFFCLLFFGWYGVLLELTTQFVFVLLQFATGAYAIHEFLSIQALWLVYGSTVSLVVNALVVLPLQQRMRGRWDFARPTHSALFMLAAAAACALAGLAQSIRLLALGYITDTQWGEAFVLWLIGDFIGIITLTPLLMVRACSGLSHYLQHGSWRRLTAEKGVRRLADLKTSLIVVVALLFVFGIPWRLGLNVHLPFFALLLLLPLAGVGLRFGLRSSVLAVVLLDSGLVMLISFLGRPDDALKYQLVMIAIALVGLWLGGSVEAHDRLMMRYRDFAGVSNDLSLLQNVLRTGNFFCTKARKGGAGGHFWHDAVIDANTITPAKWMLPDAT